MDVATEQVTIAADSLHDVLHQESHQAVDSAVREVTREVELKNMQLLNLDGINHCDANDVDFQATSEVTNIPNNAFSAEVNPPFEPADCFGSLTNNPCCEILCCFRECIEGYFTTFIGCFDDCMADLCCKDCDCDCDCNCCDCEC